MKWIVSRYNHKVSYIKDYTDDVLIYDRSPKPLEGSIIMPNLGTDWYDKFTYIIEHYESLPDVALYTKANLFDYIKPREFEKIKDNTTFTPVLSQEHHTYEPICKYVHGMYAEANNMWYLEQYPCESEERKQELIDILGIQDKDHVLFAPGSSYILPKETILKYPRAFYEKLRSFLEWSRYPGEAQLIERGIYNLWK